MDIVGAVGGAVRGMMDRFRGQGEPASVPTMPDASDQEFLDLIEQRYRWARSKKDFMLKTWATILAFYQGEQWRRWDRSARRLVRPKHIPSWRTQLTYNRIPVFVETAAAKLSRSRQLPKAMPNTNEPEDEAGAQAGSQGLEHWWHVDAMDAKELEANIGRILFGCSFYHDYWDANKMARIQVNDLMTGRPRAVRAPVGDVATEVLTVFDVFPEPCEKWGDVTWVVLAKRKPLSWFRETFADKGHLVKPDSEEVGDVLSSLIPGHAESTAEGSAPDGDGLATLKIYYQLPSKKFPKGRHGMTGGSLLLFRADRLPMPHLELPVTMKGYRLVPKRLWPMGLIEGLIDPQRELNRARSNVSEIFKLHRSPKWAVSKQSGVDLDAITDSPEEVLLYNEKTAAPYPIPPPVLPAWIPTYGEQQTLEMQELAGQHEVSKGQVPAGVTAAAAISLLQQADDTRMSVPSLLGKYALETLARHQLITMVERWRERRLVTTLGRDRAAQIYALTGADIGDRDVLVHITEGMADSGAARTQKLVDFQQAGLFQIPVPLQLAFFHEIGEQWLVDAIQAAQPAIQAAQQQQMLMQQATALDAQEAQGADEATRARRDAQGQERQRKHELAMVGVKALMSPAGKGGR